MYWPVTLHIKIDTSVIWHNLSQFD